jgi:hypothetical protein
MHVQGDQESIYAGQPLSIRLEIGTSFHWGSVGDPAKTEYNMRYIVQESVTDWLVSGHKRADFIARVSPPCCRSATVTQYTPRTGRGHLCCRAHPGASAPWRALITDYRRDTPLGGQRTRDARPALDRDVSCTRCPASYDPASRRKEHICRWNEWRHVDRHNRVQCPQSFLGQF